MKYVPNPVSFFVYFRLFLNTMTNTVGTKFDCKSIDGVLGIWTWDRIMVGADESTELWWPPKLRSFALFELPYLWLKNFFLHWTPTEVNFLWSGYLERFAIQPPLEWNIVPIIALVNARQNTCNL